MSRLVWLVLIVLVVASFAPDVLAQQGLAPEATEIVESQEAERTLADWWAMGGWVMWVLLGMSVLVVAIVLERLWSLRRGAVIPRRFMTKVMEHWNKREIREVLALCGGTNVSIARVLRSGLIHFNEGMARVEDAVTAAGEHEATLLRRNLGVLAALGNMATMMGLLGTVLGMIQSFDLIAKTGTGDARVVAGGIFQALVTTAAGLMVGLAAIGFHSYLRRKVEVLEIDLEETSVRMIEELSIDRGETKPLTEA